MSVTVTVLPKFIVIITVHASTSFCSLRYAIQPEYQKNTHGSQEGVGPFIWLAAYVLRTQTGAARRGKRHGTVWPGARQTMYVF